MRRSVLGVLLILLALLLFARSGMLLRQERAPEPVAAAGTPLPTMEPSLPPTPEPTPVPTPEPTATPAPTPRPLLDARLTDSVIDASFLDLPSEPGTLVKDVAYRTKDYVGGREGDVQKLMQVYLPYGYDENEHYDVLFLLHVRRQDERFWLEQPHEYQTPTGEYYSVDAVRLLDNLIERGFCRPLIVVSLCGYLDWDAMEAHRSEQVYPQFTQEFSNDILPFVAENYATWAEDSSREALHAARQHFGVLGASFGAYQTELCVLASNLDLVSWFTMTGGGSVSYDYLYPEWARCGTLDEPIDLLYFEEGEYDDIGPVEGSYLALANWTEKFTKDENLRFTRVLGAGHEQREWVNALYNTLQLFFR